MNSMNKEKEFFRQCIHMIYGMLLILILYLFGKNSLYVYLFILACGILLSWASRRYNLPIITKFVYLCERENYINTMPGYGALALTIGSLLAVLLFSKEIAFLSILFLTFSDSIGTLIGVYFGRTPLFRKTLEGSMACFLTTFFLGAVYLPIHIAFIAGLITVFAEIFPYKYNNYIIDDNILIPLLTGGFLQFLQILHII